MAAEQGHVDANVNLGVMYDQGLGIDRSPKDAERCFLYASEAGDAVAQFNLATMYESGRGIRKSMRKAIRYYTLSADQGYEDAILSLRRIEQN